MNNSNTQVRTEKDIRPTKLATLRRSYVSHGDTGVLGTSWTGLRFR